MHITEDAKAVMDEVLAARNCDSILLDIIRQDDQDAISVHVGNSSEFDESMIFFIDGVNIVATEETMDALRNVTFITDEEGRLTILQHGCCGHGHGHEGGCCGGHGHDHDHEGGCCGGHGHDHDHEGGCCGGHGHDHDHEGGCCCHDKD